MGWGAIVPCVPTYDRACAWAKAAIERGGAQTRIGPKLASLFAKAGLPSVTMERLGVATAEEVDIATLADRIAVEVGADAALIGRAEVAAWART